MDRFLVALIGMPLAFVIVYYRKEIKDFVGDISFAERIFGVGGTHTFILFLALIVFAGSLMYGLGTLQDLFRGILGPLFGVS
jgi:hypothetical protein